MPTDPAREFELMFRLYAPTKALFERRGSCRNRAVENDRRPLDQSAAIENPTQTCGTFRSRVDNFIRAETDLYLAPSP